jgi:hypothetical protein
MFYVSFGGAKWGHELMEGEMNIMSSLLQYILVRLYFHIMLCLGELGGSDVIDNPSSMRSSI